jgi:hypothetical protein
MSLLTLLLPRERAGDGLDEIQRSYDLRRHRHPHGIMPCVLGAIRGWLTRRVLIVELPQGLRQWALAADWADIHASALAPKSFISCLLHNGQLIRSGFICISVSRNSTSTAQPHRRQLAWS